MITLQLEDNELAALYAIFDRAFKNNAGGGMDVFAAVAHFHMKIEQARPRMPQPPPATPFVPDREELARQLEKNLKKQNGQPVKDA
jgi:hypothetical protein